MGNYNADDTPDLAQANILISNLLNVSNRPLYFDQWTISADSRVVKYCDGNNITNIRIKCDPTEFPT